MTVQFNAYTVIQLWLVYYISEPELKNILNLQIMQYFPNTLYLGQNVADLNILENST